MLWWSVLIIIFIYCSLRDRTNKYVCIFSCECPFKSQQNSIGLMEAYSHTDTENTQMTLKQTKRSEWSDCEKRITTRTYKGGYDQRSDELWMEYRWARRGVRSLLHHIKSTSICCVVTIGSYRTTTLSPFWCCQSSTALCPRPKLTHSSLKKYTLHVSAMTLFILSTHGGRIMPVYWPLLPSHQLCSSDHRWTACALSRI